MADPELAIHPGEILREEFLLPYGLTPSELAVRLGLPANRMTRLVNGDTDVSHETAVLLGVVFGTSTAFWLNLQLAFDLDTGTGKVPRDRLELARRLRDDLVAA